MTADDTDNHEGITFPLSWIQAHQVTRCYKFCFPVLGNGLNSMLALWFTLLGSSVRSDFLFGNPPLISDWTSPVTIYSPWFAWTLVVFCLINSTTWWPLQVYLSPGGFHPIFSRQRSSKTLGSLLIGCCRKGRKIYVSLQSDWQSLILFFSKI